MARAIDADALQELCNRRIQDTWNSKVAPVSWAEAYADFKDDIDSIPTLTPPNDFTPVQHGRWVKPVPGDGENYCSVCHAVQPWFYGYGYYDSDYCPNCGACMDAKEELKDGKDY